VQYWESRRRQWTIIDGLADYHTDVEGAQTKGRYLTRAPFGGNRLGEWRERLVVSPYFRPGTTYDEMFQEGGAAPLGTRSSRVIPGAGTGLVAGFLARLVAEPDVEILLSLGSPSLARQRRGGGRARGSGPDGAVERRGTVVLRQQLRLESRSW
jgi:3-oxosteroid 1-dehydrogenase